MEIKILSGQSTLNNHKEYLKILIKTRKGTLPGNRDYGLESSFLDAPPQEAGTRFAMDVFTSARDWIEGAEVKETKLTANGNGKVTALIEIESGDDYE